MKLFKNIEFQNPLYVSIFVYIGICLIFLNIKPQCFYYKNKLKSFGFRYKDETLFNLYVVSLIFSILTYVYLKIIY